MSIKSKISSFIFASRLRAMEHTRIDALSMQREQLRLILAQGADTQYGYQNNLREDMTPHEFAMAMPTVEYEDLQPYIERMRQGESDVLWTGRINWFAKSSGTTDRSKYIPVTDEGLRLSHMRGPRDVAAQVLQLYPQTKAFDGKLLTLGGSRKVESEGDTAMSGDLSAIMIEHTPWFAQKFRAPSREVALIENFDKKCEAICKECVEQDITSFAGVPSWNMLLMERVLEYTGKKNLLEVWENLSMFIHGGVSFKPYREQFQRLIPSEQMNYIETYNASEGFFAIQDRADSDDMLLMCDYGQYYEFDDGQNIVPLEGVKVGVDYALIITSVNGLWRYRIGDTVAFTSTNPYRLRITGRTKQFINVFGEELMVGNAEEALQRSCETIGARISEYTVAPIFMTLEERGGHQWVIEFTKQPDDIEQFAEVLDTQLREINSDYDAKRGSTLRRLQINVVEQGHFLAWMRSRGAVGGQNKVPRLSNKRDYVESILGDFNAK